MRLEAIRNDPFWRSSLGEKIGKVHFRKGHLHAECDPKTGICKIHRDRHDPHESVDSLLKHMIDSNGGKIVLSVLALGIIDQILTGGSIRKTLLKI